MTAENHPSEPLPEREPLSEREPKPERPMGKGRGMRVVLSTYVAGLELFGEHGEFDAGAEPLVLVNDEGDGDAGGADLPGELYGGLRLGAAGGTG
ncbi:hypothetical protein [Kitasatospora purpeofusca]|uniref:hypothetical protein n=1 Tax=Kitasatospora purpeofusca TaxID=67352 RepID=UPI00386468C3|nr:hypothetical protein OIP63_36740 [Kitasatospora purpeofusca]